jgi:Uma2 family endonuclease
MATHTKVPLGEYLRTSYHPDREFLDGEVLERSVGGYPHSRVQGRLSLALGKLSGAPPLYICPELRVQVAENRYRVIDLAVYREAEPAERFPSVPPFIAIEILSPTDPTADTFQKLEEYSSWGVSHIWLIDPEARRLFVYDQSALRAVDKLELSELRAEILAASIF